jgi:hypothetical protein
MILMLAIGAAILADYDEPPFDPFSPYANIMLGQSTNALAEQGFSCKDSFLTGGSGYRYYCTALPTSGDFYQIDLAPYSGKVIAIRFQARANTLKVGHLVTLWGKPEISIYDQTISLYWEAESIRAFATNQGHHFSYFLPVQTITFT